MAEVRNEADSAAGSTVNWKQPKVKLPHTQTIIYDWLNNLAIVMETRTLLPYAQKHTHSEDQVSLTSGEEERCEAWGAGEREEVMVSPFGL